MEGSTAIWDRVAAALTGRRRLAATTIVLLSVAAVGGAARIQLDDEPRKLIQQSDADFAALQRLFKDFGPDDNDVLYVVRGEDLFSVETMDDIEELARRAGEIEGVRSVFSILNVRRAGGLLVPLIPRSPRTQERLDAARRLALAHPMVAGQLLSDDGKTMLVMVRLEGGSLTVSQLTPVVERLERLAREIASRGRLEAGLAGSPPLRVDMLTRERRERLRMLLLAAAVSSAIAAVLFRGLSDVAITTAGPAVGVLWIVGAMGLAGEPMNVINMVLPALLFIVGFTDSVHLMFHARRWRAEGVSPRKAGRDAIGLLGAACGLTSLTTAIGFGSLWMARTESIREFGMACAVGALIMFAAVISVVPLLITLWSGEPRGGAGLLRGGAPRRSVISPAVQLVVRRPRPFAIAGVGATLALAIGAARLRPDVKWTELLPEDSGTIAAMEDCDEAFGGALLAYVTVQWPDRCRLDSPELIEVVADVHKLLDQNPKTRGPLSVLNLLQSLPGSNLANRARQLRRVPPDLLRRYVRPDQRRLVVSAHVRNVGAAELEPSFDELDGRLAQLHREHPGFRLQLTGTSVVAARNVQGMISDLGKSVGMAFLFVFLVMAAAFRSLLLGLISVIPNLFPLLIAANLLVWFGQPLDITSVMTFCICLGIAVDDTIHLLVRFQRERAAGRSIPEALTRAADAVGGALVMTSAILLGGFASITIASTPALRLFARLSCAAMASALVGDLLILPALVMASRRLLERRAVGSGDTPVELENQAVTENL